MDDVKDKVKGFMKKVNNPFSSSSSSFSSGKFKGQGRVLGSSSSSSSSSSPLRNPAPLRPSPTARSQPKPTSQLSDQAPKSLDCKPSTGQFDPFDPLISSGKRTVNGHSWTLVECPVCTRSFTSEEEVSEHVEACLAESFENGLGMSNIEPDAEVRDDLAARVGVFMSGEPLEGSVEVVLKLLRNIIREPENVKFRKVRMSNPKIKEAVGMAKGGMELLECVGFRLVEEEEEIWATMDVPAEEQIFLIKEAVSLLERWKAEDTKPKSSSAAVENLVEKKKIDRQVRVFFSVPESVAAKIDLPDSFYNLSAEELKREADLRKKKMAESQLLIPKSYKEKQMKAARKRYKATVIRIQFPDGLVLQGVFLPREPTTALYEFVSSALKEPGLEFELLPPAVPKLRVIPRFSRSGERPPTLEEEDLVPSALVQFKPIETDSIVFTGLSNELLEAIEPLTSTTPDVNF